MTNKIEDYIKLAEAASEGEWFASHPSPENDDGSGLCQIDDGREHGMFSFCCEWHDGRFIAASRTFGPALAKALLEAEEALRRQRVYFSTLFEIMDINEDTTSIGIEHPTKGSYHVSITDIFGQCDASLATIQKLKEQA